MMQEIIRSAGSVATGIALFTLLLGLAVFSRGGAVEPAFLLREGLQIAFLVTLAVGLVILSRRTRTQHAENLDLIRELETTREEGDRWRSRAQAQIDGVGAAIEKQFEAWSLTVAESEVGYLMLKGFVHKEVAGLRGTSEATVRQQARAIYQKSRLEGRSAFCAYFLEDLLPSTGRLHGAELDRAADGPPVGLQW